MAIYSGPLKWNGGLEMSAFSMDSEIVRFCTKRVDECRFEGKGAKGEREFITISAKIGFRNLGEQQLCVRRRVL